MSIVSILFVSCRSITSGIQMGRNEKVREKKKKTRPRQESDQEKRKFLIKKYQSFLLSHLK